MGSKISGCSKTFQLSHDPQSYIMLHWYGTKTWSLTTSCTSQICTSDFAIKAILGIFNPMVTTALEIEYTNYDCKQNPLHSNTRMLTLHKKKEKKKKKA